jgi:hypothetical protein
MQSNSPAVRTLSIVLAVQGLRNPAERGHVPGDVLALLLIAVVLGYLAARASGTGAGMAHAAGAT